MSDQHYYRIADILLELERELRRLDLWESQPPTPEQLASTMPFAVDTLTFPQWLQFVFIERMAVILQAGAELPRVSGIQPMAEEYFRQAELAGEKVIAILGRFDRICPLPQ